MRRLELLTSMNTDLHECSLSLFTVHWSFISLLSSVNVVCCVAGLLNFTTPSLCLATVVTAVTVFVVMG